MSMNRWLGPNLPLQTSFSHSCNALPVHQSNTGHSLYLLGCCSIGLPPRHLCCGTHTEMEPLQDHNGLMVQADTRMVIFLVWQADGKGGSMDGLQGARVDS